jgi:hypothetical protein
MRKARWESPRRAADSGSNKTDLQTEQIGGSVAMPGADRHALAAGGAAAAKHGCAGFGLHARPEAMCFRAVASVGLKGALGHRDPLLFPKENLRVSNIFEYTEDGRGNPTRVVGQFGSVLKGHDFSRAANRPKRVWASAPEGWFPSN